MSAPQQAADRNPGLILGPSLLRFRHRLLRDEQFLLALTLAVGAIVIALVGGEATIGLVALAGLLFVAVQGSIAIMAGPSRRRRADTVLPLVRFAIAVAFVTAFNGLIGDATYRPAAVLYIPIVALASAFGAAQAIVVGLLEIALFLVVVLFRTPDRMAQSAERAIGLTVTVIVLAIGIRRTVAAMNNTTNRLRTARAIERRRTRQISAVDAVGRLLASTGPTDETLDRVIDLLEVDLGYSFVSVYLGEAGAMRLVASRGYKSVIDMFDGSSGIMGRVMREPARQRSFPT